MSIRPLRSVVVGFASLAVLAGGTAAWAITPASAQASVCGTSGTDQICVATPASQLSGDTWVQVTDSTSATQTLQVYWNPASGQQCLPNVTGSCYLITQFGANPGTTSDYSFMWPTQKYLDGGGTLQVRVKGATTSVKLPGLQLSNGNAGSILPANQGPSNSQPPADTSWPGTSDPTIAATGDGPDDQPQSNAEAASIAANNPPLFLFLGDVYEVGSYSEMLNHYGWNVMDGPCPFPAAECGPAWGQLASVTQPTIGNHEYEVSPNDGSAWTDYWGQRSLWTSFTFGNVLFLDLDSGTDGSLGTLMGVGSPQYTWVQNVLSQPNLPPCIVAYWHIPALKPNGAVNTGAQAMWQLLNDRGVSLVLDGHIHVMAESVPLNDQLQPAQPGQNATVELIAGAGGHNLGKVGGLNSRFDWGVGATPGAVYLTLNGAAAGGTPTSLSWQYRGTDNGVLHSGGIACNGSPPPAPTVSSFSPASGSPGTQVTISGSAFTGATSVSIAGTNQTSLTVNSDTSITTTVPNGASGSGPVCVTTAAGTGCSGSSFTVTSPPSGSPQRVGQIGTVTNTSGTIQNSLPLTVNAPVAAGDTIVVGVGAQGNVSVTSATDSRGNTYHVDAARQYTASTGVKSTTALLTAPVTTALQAGDTITVTVSTGNAWGFVAEDWSGISGLDQTGTADSGGTTSSTVSVSTSASTATAPEAVFAVTATAPWPGITAGSGYTESADLQLSQGTAKREFGLEYAIVSSTSTQTATFGLGSARYWVAAIGTYR